MSRIILSTEPVTVSAIAVERAQEFCKLFDNFVTIGVNSIGVLYAEWRSELPTYMEIKRELLKLLDLPATKDVLIFNVLEETIPEHDILTLDNVHLHEVMYSDADHMYHPCQYEYEENEVCN